MGTERKVKADEIEVNAGINLKLTLGTSGDFIVNGDNIEEAKVLEVVDVSGDKVIKTSVIDQSNITKDNLEATVDPTINDDLDLDYTIGSKWFNKSSGQMYIATDVTDGAAVWTQVQGTGGGGGGNDAVTTKTADYTALGTDGVILVDALSNDITITLLTASGNTGFNLEIKRIDDSFFIKEDTFVDGDVTVGTDNINTTGHPYQDLQKVQATSSGTLPAGLALATDYWIIYVDIDNIKLASSRANAVSDTAVDITAAAGGGTHTITTVRNIVTIDANVSETIDGNLTRTLATQNEIIKIMADGTNWQIKSREYDKTAIEAGPITIEGSTTNPTKPTVVDTDSFLMTRYANGYDIEYNYFASLGSGGNSGSGVYSFLIPFGLLIPADRDTDSTTGNFSYGITLGNGKIGNGSSSSFGVAHAFDTSHFGLSSVAGSKVDSASFALGLNGVMYRMIIRIPIEGMEG